MIYQLEAALRKAQRWISRSEWAIRLLGMTVSEQTTTEPGLVMIQVDGLSRSQLEQALKRNELPILKRLLERERFQLHSLYSGLPSTTPAVQAEIFYGAKTAVPAFSFMDRESGAIVKMIEPKTAARIERQLALCGTALLEGGSGYSNVFTGGAAESHFCPASLGWGEVLRGANPFVVMLFLLLNAYSFVRTAALMAVETALAVGDCVFGLFQGRDVFKEIAFIPTRVAICILLRELVTIGAKIDIARGLPIIHVNYLGYDEQAHRRGPSSRFAHWTLKGIDDAIGRVWRAATNSARRDYDLWIYSDHGQEETRPYPVVHGLSIEEAVIEVFEDVKRTPRPGRPEPPHGTQLQRARLLGGRRVQKLLPAYHEAPSPPIGEGVKVVAMGPIGLVYADRAFSDGERDRLVQGLIDRLRVPMVLAQDQGGVVRAWCSSGRFMLPQQAAEILGTDHPFAAEAVADLITLCRHPSAGDFVLCGWRAGEQPLSFPIENGAHGGPGPEETHGFTVIPGDANFPDPDRGYMRPLDVRTMALEHLGRSKTSTSLTMVRKAPESRTIRVMTYNVHSCIGMDGKHAPRRIARVIAQQAPDIVALQELDVGRDRTGGVDQAQLIAEFLKMEFHFHPGLKLEEELYGDAILSRYPMRLMKAGALPGISEKPNLEPRGALWVEVEALGQKIQVFNTHLGLNAKERFAQTEALLSESWLSAPACKGPIVLCGDFNAVPSSTVCRLLRNRFNDAQTELPAYRPRATWFARYPSVRLDHIFLDPSLQVVGVDVVETALTRVASDHLPQIVEIRRR